ncbi:MAG TPA: molybdopterin-dependent oxidoreductase [Thermoanaerobaculia bacterium]|jgi:anaerobic selenocysteine-containing dehydrogenase|nr:molybdopterin-dependent oxidoreductase [Thermoanaerobaculia bacterium]
MASLPPRNGQVRGACPLDCPDTCGWIVTVENGEPVALRGDPAHPYTRGSLCNKVADYLSYARSSDRLLVPLRRSGPKGSGDFVRISWEEALARIAAGLGGAIAKHGAEAVLPYGGSGNMGLIQGIYGAGRRLWNVLGTSRPLYTLCTIAGGFGTGFTLGDNRVGMDPETFRFSKLAVLWGTNVLSTHHHLWRPVLEARKNGASVVAIDPIRTRTAAACDGHLAPVPGTDAALALGLLHVVLSEGGEDRRFIAERTVGWEAFRRRILDFPPSRAAAITGLPAASIVELGKRLAGTRPTGIRIGIGLQRHGGGGMAVRTITCIPGVTGDWQYPGGGVFYDTRGFFGVDWGALWRDDLRTRPARELDMKRLGEILLAADDPPVQALFVYAANPAASAPNQTKVLRGLARDDLFTVVVEHFLTDTARYADVVLPATMATEHQDLLIAYGHLYLAWNEPAAPPPGECLPATEIFRRLARTMGLDAPALYDGDEAIARQILGSGHPSLAGITFEELKARGWMRLSVPDPFVPFAGGFPTASGKLEFVSDRMARCGLDPVAGYSPAHEASQRDTDLAGEYPLALVTPADHYFLNSIFANVPKQRRRAGAATLLIHPDDAAPRRIAAGDEVRVANARGAFFAVAEVSDRIRPGVVASTKGRWPGGSKEGATINATVDERDSDMGRGAVYHDNRVRVERVA